MTLNWNKTADDDTLIQALIPLIQGRIWYDWDRRRWYQAIDGTWAKVQLVVIQTTLLSLADQLPPGPYWDRSRRRLGTFSAHPPILAQIRLASFRGQLTPPAVGDLP